MNWSRLMLAGALALSAGLAGGCRTRAGMLPEGMAVKAAAESEFAPQVLLLKRMSECGLDSTEFRLRGHLLEIYLVAAKSYDGELLARAYDANGREVGRVIVELEIDRYEARFVAFNFPGVADMASVTKILIAPPGAE